MSRYIEADLADRLLTDGYGIDEIPSSDVAPVVHARWIVINRDTHKSATCTHCWNEFLYWKGHLQIGLMPYCPKCGARMVEEVRKDGTL